MARTSKRRLKKANAKKKQIVNAAYEGASNGRRSLAWSAPSSGPNSALSTSLPNLRNRSRAAYRNNPYLFKAIDALVANEIGTGITPRSRASDDDVKSQINRLWSKSHQQFDTEGVLDFYGLQAQIVRARRSAGEVFIRKRRRFIGEIHVPVQLQVLESEFVPADKNEILSNGNTVRSGIEFNKRGKRVAYHIYAEHPQDGSGAFSSSNRLLRIPARDVIHHYMPTRPGQVRGEPDAVQSLLKAHTFDSYDDAELVRKQTKAPYTGFISQDSFNENDYKYNPMTGESIETDSSGFPMMNVEPGSIISGLPGESLEMFKGDDTGQGYADFMRQQLLSIAAGVGLPYELMTGDWSKVNDRLVRAILNEFRRQVEMAQDHLTTFQVCRGVWEWWMDAGVASGALELSDYINNKDDYMKVEWRPQAWAYVHPEQDINARIKAIDNNLTSRDAEIAKSGWDGEEIDKQNVESRKRLKEMENEAGLETETDIAN